VPYVRATAWKRWRTLNPPWKAFDQERAVHYDDFVEAGLVGLWRAINTWMPGHRLNTFARHHIAAAMSDTAQGWRNKSGISGLASKLQRIMRSHPDWSADQIAQVYATTYRVTRIPGQPRHLTAAEYVAQEQDIAFAAAWRPTSYTEGAVVDDTIKDDEHKTTAAATKLPADIEGPTSDGTRRAAAGYWGPEKRSRNLRSWQRRGNRIVAPVWDDHVWHHHEHHTQALLKWMGSRQRFADTLVAQNQDTYYEVRDGRLVEPSTKPVPFESQVTTYYRGTSLAAAKLIPVVQAESVRHVVPMVDVTISRSSGLPLRMPEGQAGASYWNSGGWNGSSLSRSLRRARTLNL
jgi:hypothetical protein